MAVFLDAVDCDVIALHESFDCSYTVVLTESLVEQHVNGRRHQFMLTQLRQRLCARKSIFVRGFLYSTTANELSDVFRVFGSISKVILNQTKVSFSKYVF